MATATEIRYYTTVEAAKRLGVTNARIRQLCWKMVHPRQKHGLSWMLTDADIERMQSRRKYSKKQQRTA